jgi:hypothetical protein
MSKTASRIALVAGSLVLVVVVAAVVVLGRLGRLIEHGVETAGPKITGTEVTLGSARVSIFDGTGALKRLHIGNPEGFTADEAFDLGEIAIAIDVKSVTGNVIRIRSIVVQAPKLVAEFDAAGRNNLGRILDNVRASRGGTRTGKEAAEDDGGKPVRLIIDEFRFEGAEVHALAPAYQLDKRLKLAPIVLKNLGAKQGGAAAADLANQVLRPIIDAAVQAALKEYLAAQRDKLGDKAKDQLLDKLLK